MLRDYSEELKANLKAMAEAVEPDGVWENISDFFGDGYVSIREFFGDYDIEDYLDNMNEYYVMMINKDDVTSQRIDEIFAAVDTVDTTCQQEFSTCGELLTTINGFLSQFAGAIETSNVDFCKPNQIPDITSAPGYADYQKDFIDAYEASHPEEAAAMNEAFDGMMNGAYTYDEDGNPIWHDGVPDDVDNIKFIIYSAEEPYRSLFVDNIGKVDIVPTDGGSCYTRNGENGETIKINWNDTSIMANNSGGAYSTIFHEFGHFLDDIYNPDGDCVTREYTTPDGEPLQDVIDRDVYNAVARKVAELNPGASDEFIQEVTDRITKGNLPGYVDDDSQEVIDASKDAVKAINKDLKTGNALIVGDTYDGSTNCLTYSTNHPIPPQYESENTGKGVGPGHDNDYYFGYTIDPDTQELTVGERKASGSTEGFANYFSVCIRGYDDYADVYDNYLPETSDCFDDILDDMANTEL